MERLTRTCDDLKNEIRQRLAELEIEIDNLAQRFFAGCRQPDASEDA